MLREDHSSWGWWPCWPRRRRTRRSARSRSGPRAPRSTSRPRAGGGHPRGGARHAGTRRVAAVRLLQGPHRQAGQVGGSGFSDTSCEGAGAGTKAPPPTKVDAPPPAKATPAARRGADDRQGVPDRSGNGPSRARVRGHPGRDGERRRCRAGRRRRPGGRLPARAQPLPPLVPKLRWRGRPPSPSGSPRPASGPGPSTAHTSAWPACSCCCPPPPALPRVPDREVRPDAALRLVRAVARRSAAPSADGARPPRPSAPRCRAASTRCRAWPRRCRPRGRGDLAARGLRGRGRRRRGHVGPGQRAASRRRRSSSPAGSRSSPGRPDPARTFLRAYLLEVVWSRAVSFLDLHPSSAGAACGRAPGGGPGERHRVPVRGRRRAGRELRRGAAAGLPVLTTAVERARVHLPNPYAVAHFSLSLASRARRWSWRSPRGDRTRGRRGGRRGAAALHPAVRRGAVPARRPLRGRADHPREVARRSCSTCARARRIRYGPAHYAARTGVAARRGRRAGRLAVRAMSPAAAP